MNKSHMYSSHTCSFVIPAYNEVETLGILVDQINGSCERCGVGKWEILLIDDGSRDGSWQKIRKLQSDPSRNVKGVRMRTNSGKASALAAGFELAEGDLIFTLDADLQDDPEEIPKFIEKLQEGYDLVSGWKHNRKDPIDKTLPSKVFNAVVSKVSGLKIHDMNCGFKLYRKEVIKSVELYGELHRFIPILADSLGFAVAEVEVKHRPREHGVSKYGYKRFVRGSIDLLTVLATTRYIARPAHLFGTIGGVLGLLGFGILGYLSILWCLGLGPIGNRPLFFLGILSVISAVQLISFGLLAELITKRSNKDAASTLVAETIGIGDRPKQ